MHYCKPKHMSVTCCSVLDAQDGMTGQHAGPSNARVNRFGNFDFFEIFGPGLDPEPVCMRRNIAGRALKVGFGRVFLTEDTFSVKLGPPSAPYPFFGPLILEGFFRKTSTRLIVCSSSCARSSNLISVYQSVLNHRYFQNQ